MTVLGTNLRKAHRSEDGRGPVVSVSQAAMSRRSVRVLTDKKVDRSLLTEILAIAGRAPSGSNVQPWHCFALTGDTLSRVGKAMQAEFEATAGSTSPDYSYYAAPLPEPYLSRRRACGWGLYGQLQIGRGDVEKARAYRVRNYNFFGAPVGLVFTIHRAMEKGSYLEYGMFLQSLMLAAREAGLDTCPQFSIAEYPGVLRSLLPIPEQHMILCGMALGYADPAAQLNTYQPARVQVEEFATFLD